MNIFMLRSKPNNIERINHFLNQDEVGIGWYETGDLTGASKEDIRDALKELGYEGQSLLTNLGMVNAFVNTMKEGDIVLIREGATVHIGEVKAYDWKTEPEYVEKRMGHIRPTKWLAHVPFKDLNAEMQSLLKNIRTICKYKGSLEQSELSKYITNEQQGKSESKKDNENESLRLNTIEVLKDLMNNAENESVRLEAAKELLKHLNNE
ncbi:hypothetical protein [Fictibacillus halophilus]|uniref:hypothetical protein n=1 Tax=Fictibacillus halophilus TaxID=1610490 RepID=UPI001CFC4028|nr:hypothetical protein [Fictibacillus halophilus]